MTEISELPKTPLWPMARRTVPLIDPVAFGAALLLAPFFVAICGFWALLIPVFALWFGLPVYLAAFTPAMLALSLRREITPHFAAVTGLAINMLVCLPPVLWMLATQQRDAMVWLTLYLGFGSVHALLWGAAFGWLYRKFRRDFRAAFPA